MTVGSFILRLGVTTQGGTDKLVDRLQLQLLKKIVLGLE